MRRLVFISFLSSPGLFVAAACGSETNDTATGGDTTGDESEEFGFVCLRLVNGEEPPTDPFAGTTKIYVSLHYDQCLIEFYETHPERRLDGAEGPALFEAWRERLCDEPVGEPLAACFIDSLDSFQQDLIDDGQASLYRLAITYDVFDASQLDGRLLLWGPVPLGASAGCPEGQDPTVTLSPLDGVRGLDPDGALTWGTVASSNTTISPGHDAKECVEIRAGTG